MKESCASCKFFIRNSSSDGDECMRFTRWLGVNDRHWCGEYQKREKYEFKDSEAGRIIGAMSLELLEHKEKFAAAFLKETGLQATDVVMIQRYVQGGIEISFRPKTVKEMGDM